MKNFWTKKEEDMLRKYYENNSNKELALYLDRTPNAVGTKGRKMGLKKSAEARREHTKKTHFKKGHKPWHAGLKGIQIGRKDTQFQKGHTPVTARPVGSIRVTYFNGGNSYKFIKTENGEWVRLHRLVWEQHNGKIPEGYYIGFKDRDTLNCDIDNLECLSRKDNFKTQTEETRKKRSISMRAYWRIKKGV